MDKISKFNRMLPEVEAPKPVEAVAPTSRRFYAWLYDLSNSRAIFTDSAVVGVDGVVEEPRGYMLAPYTGEGPTAEEADLMLAERVREALEDRLANGADVFRAHARHTRGPWSTTLERTRDEANVVVRDAEGLVVAFAADRNRTDKDAEVDATARLIAAAPEVAAALYVFLANPTLGRMIAKADPKAHEQAVAALEKAGPQYRTPKRRV